MRRRLERFVFPVGSIRTFGRPKLRDTLRHKNRVVGGIASCSPPDHLLRLTSPLLDFVASGDSTTLGYNT
jgi:hypothetical protein